MSKTAFERYAPFIQEYIYRNNWADLREVQVETCSMVLDTNSHVLVASKTASGKTEAAFFPVLTDLYYNPSESIGVLYISPLKALINDQFKRLNGLLKESNIPVWPWHGDISQSIKKRAVKEARGIIQTTPESLEALLMKEPHVVARVFSDLRFILIDEIHAFMGADRGLQLICLLSRLERIADCLPRRIGLSATLNDYQFALKFLSAGSRNRGGGVVVSEQAHERKIAIGVESFCLAKEPDTARDVFGGRHGEFIYKNFGKKKEHYIR